MKPPIQFLQLRFVRKWELSNYKTQLILDKDIKYQILNFVNESVDDESVFINNGDSRRACNLYQRTSPFSNLVREYRKKVFKEINLNISDEESWIDIFVGVNTETGFVHGHLDSTKQGCYHVRLNFLVSKPFDGGIPLIEGRVIDVDEDESWINLASEWWHSSTPVVGDKPRIVLSLGALVEKTQLDPILKDMGIE